MQNNIQLSLTKLPMDIISDIEEKEFITGYIPTQYSTKIRVLLKYLRKIPKVNMFFPFFLFFFILTTLYF